MKTDVEIDIFSDPVCPWCYIGKARLEKAIKQTPKMTFKLSWRAFQLNPSMPSQGMSRARYLQTKFGSLQNAERVYAPLLEAAEQEGLVLNLDAIQRMPNSINAQRLIYWAESQGYEASPFIEDFFVGFFVDGLDIGETSVILDIGEKNGIDRQRTRQFLNSESGLDKITKDEKEARRLGINGVPYFTVNNMDFGVSGAISVSSWHQYFQQI